MTLVRGILLAGAACLMLSGCFHDKDASDSTALDTGLAEVAPDTGEAQAPPAANTAPVLSGTPANGVMSGSSYSYQPSVSDADGDTLQFSISGKPDWTGFDTSTGLLSGTPTEAQTGNYDGIVISVSDGTSLVSQAAFNITVVRTDSGNGTATLSWETPAENVDSTPLTNLAGYHVYHGTRIDDLVDMRRITTPHASSYLFDALASGTHFFAVSSYTLEGVESALSAIVSKTIP